VVSAPPAMVVTGVFQVEGQDFYALNGGHYTALRRPNRCS
jgi:hypothetical protein